MILDHAAAQKREQTDTAFRNLAELLGDFRGRLLENGFSVEGAEQIVDTLTAVVLVST